MSDDSLPNVDEEQLQPLDLQALISTPRSIYKPRVLTPPVGRSGAEPSSPKRCHGTKRGQWPRLVEVDRLLLSARLEKQTFTRGPPNASLVFRVTTAQVECCTLPGLVAFCHDMLCQCLGVTIAGRQGEAENAIDPKRR